MTSAEAPPPPPSQSCTLIHLSLTAPAALAADPSSTWFVLLGLASGEGGDGGSQDDGDVMTPI